MKYSLKICIVLALCSVLSFGITGCASSKVGSSSLDADNNTITIWSFTDEVPYLVRNYLETHPNTDMNFKYLVTSSVDGAYQTVLDNSLKNPSADSPDIYAVEMSFTQKYTKGLMQKYAMPYTDLGFDMDKLAKENRIPQYTLDIGSNTDGQINGLCYQTTGGLFIYRRSIAKQVFGTDDPAEINKIMGGATDSWGDFLEAAACLGKYGYKIASGIDDVWMSYAGGSEKGWIVDGKLYIDPKREKFLEVAKTLTENDWIDGTYTWTDGWFNNMAGVSENPVFGFFGPAWFINYTMEQFCGGYDGTYGDWATCLPPSGFAWGGTWILVNKNLPKKKKAVVKDIINYITLDTSKDGLLYTWANGSMTNNIRDSVASGKVMENSYYESAFLKNQNIFEYFEAADSKASGKTVTDYDDVINQRWTRYVRMYAADQCTKKQALDGFRNEVAELLGLK